MSDNSYDATGNYLVFLEVTDVNGCTDTISKIMNTYNEMHVYIPTMFTPNGDGINDTWKPILLANAEEGYILTLFDRWGQLIFSTTDLTTSWDGTINGKHVQNNTVYAYRLIVRDFTGKEFEYKGRVAVVR